MQKSDLPDLNFSDNEANRLKELYACQILYKAEESFDRISKLAGLIFNTSGSFISFVDKDKMLMKANHSNLPDEIERRESLCTMTIMQDEATIIEDTHHFPELMLSPYVMVDGGVRFYAGAPLIMDSGYRIGAICVIDSEPRLVIRRQIEMLETLAKVVVEKLELQKKINQLEDKNQ